MHDRIRIRHLYARETPPAVIAEAVGCSRSSVYRAIAPGARLHYERARRFEDVRAAVEVALERWPLLPVHELAEMVGWDGSLRQLQREVSPIRDRFAGRVVVRPVRFVDGRAVVGGDGVEGT